METGKTYAFLHCHSDYSIKDSMAKIDDIFDYAKECGATAVAITEHGNMMSMYDADRASKRTGVKYIIGIESYIKEDGEDMRKHLVIMAKDEAGYKALIKYVTETNLRMDLINKLPYPCGNKALLEKYFGKGAPGYGHVVITSACIAGVVAANFFLNDKTNKKIKKEEEKLLALKSDTDPMYLTLMAQKDELEAEIAQLTETKKDLHKMAKKSFTKQKNAIKKMEGPEKEAAEEQLFLDMEEAGRAAAEEADVADSIKEKKAELAGIKKEMTIFTKDLTRREKIEADISEMEKTLYTEEALHEKAVETAAWYKETFSDFYMEIQNHGLEDEAFVYPRLVEIARDLNIPLVAANDSHVVRSDEDSFIARSLIRCTMFNSWEGVSDSSRQMYMKTDDELQEALRGLDILEDDISEAMANVKAIADMCNAEVPNEEHHPKFFSEVGEDAEDAMYRLCEEGKERLYGDTWTDEMEAQLRYERETISNMGFTDYFLNLVRLVPLAEMLGTVPRNRISEIPRNYQDLEAWVKENGFDTGLGVGPGRGSAAGSIVCELLGITKVNPQKYSLVFERFLNPERVTMPDIDTDIRKATRQIFLEYIRQMYGEKAVSLIQTINTLKAKEAIRTATRIRSIELFGDGETAKLYSVGDKIAKELPNDPKIKLDTYLADLESKFSSQDELAILHYAKLIEGGKTGTGPHAAGVVIFDQEDLSDYIPLAINPENGAWITQCDMNDVEDRGMLKMDMLGLNTLDIITDTQQEVKVRTGKRLTFEDMFHQEDGVYQDIANAKTDCVFQLSSAGMKSMLGKLRPEKFEDIVASVSLYRPGPMEYIPDYIKGKDNPNNVKYDTPELEPILKDTYGVLVYQEQVMQALQTLAGYPMSAADNVRRAMSKKKQHVIDAERDVFIYGSEERGIPGCVNNGIPERTAAKIFGKMEAFASYAFNKSHAAAYAMDTYMTAWLRRHYPVEFYTAVLNNKELEFTQTVLEEMTERNLVLKTPDVNIAMEDFSIIGNDIIYGLGHVKNVGASAEAIVKARKNGPFISVQDFLIRTGINKGAFEALVKAGAFDSIYPNRTALKDAVEQITRSFAMFAKAKTDYEIRGESAGDKLKRAEELFAASTNIPFKEESANKLIDEFDVLGAFVSGDPLEGYALPKDYQCTEVKETEKIHGKAWEMKLFGAIISLDEFVTKQGKKMASFKLRDQTGIIDAVVFQSTYPAVKDMLKDGVVVKCVGNINQRDDKPQYIISTMQVAEKPKREYVLQAENLEAHRQTIVPKLKPFLMSEESFKKEGGITVKVFLNDSGTFLEHNLFVKTNAKETLETM